MNRTPEYILAVLLVLSASGCIASIQEGSSEKYDDTGDGELVGIVVSDVPPDVTVVNYSDERVPANEYLTEVLRDTVDESGSGFVAVPERNVEDTKRDLKKLPFYTVEESASSEYEWGYYVRYEDTIVCVQFAVLE